MKDLRSMGKTPPEQPNVDKRTQNNVNELVDRYSTKSSAELMNELRAGKQSGMINDAMIRSAAEKMAPMLSGEQRARLDDILRQLGQP